MPPALTTRQPAGILETLPVRTFNLTDSKLRARLTYMTNESSFPTERERAPQCAIPLPPTAIAPEVKILSGVEADLLALKVSEQSKVEFTMFPDGSFFKYVPRTGFEPQCLIVDAERVQIAVARNTDIAEFLCNACNCLVIASKMNAVQEQKIVQPGSPLILPGGATPTVFES